MCIRDRRYGSFTRSFDITGIDESGITAAYQNGILELNLPCLLYTSRCV